MLLTGRIRTMHEAVHRVSFLKEEFRQIGPVLAGDACDEC